MTSEERRDFLISRDFVVASRSFPGTTGPLWYAQEPQVGLQSQREKFGSHNLFIDLETGKWQRWGERGWRDFNFGPWNELLEEDEVRSDQRTVPTPSVAPSASPSDRPYVIAPLVTPDGKPVKRLFTEACLQFFVDLVEKAGFRITEPAPKLLDGFIDLGNRYAEKDGVTYLIVCQTGVKSIIGPGFQKRTLADFLTHQITHQNDRKFTRSEPPRKSFVIGQIVQPSGNTLQKGLF